MLYFSILLILLTVSYAIFASRTTDELLQKAAQKRNEANNTIQINAINNEGILNIEIERDIDVLKRYGVNLMDDHQLSEVQIADKPPYQISIFAPEPLELYSESVYQSTLEWTRRHIQNEHRDKRAAKMIFWSRASEQKPRMLQVVSRLFNDLGNDPRVFEILECVKAPDHLFFIDMTMHFFENNDVQVYINPRSDGKTNFLVELSKSHAIEVARMFLKWYEDSTVKTLNLQVARQGLTGASLYEIKCREVNYRATESKETVAIIENMFPKQLLSKN